MSIKTMNYVWDNSSQTGSALLMLIAIADHANDDGVCWPSIARLAKRARVSQRQAQYIVKKLEESGELEVRRGQGRGNTSLYIVKGAADCTINDAEKVQPIAPNEPVKGAIQREKVQSSALKGATHCTQNHKEPPIETRERPLSTPRRASLVAQGKTATAGELGIAPALLTTLTNTVLDLTGMRALADAGDDFKLRDAQDAAIHLARMGYGSTDLLKDLGDAWKTANQWRNGSRPTIRNLKEFASQQAATGNTASTNGQWGAISDSVPDYMKG